MKLDGAARTRRVKRLWKQYKGSIHKHGILRDVEYIDFVRVIILLATRERGLPIGCKPANMLEVERGEFKQWAPRVKKSFETAARFLHSQHVYDSKFLPYRRQLIPLAAILAVLKKAWNTPQAKEKLARWYWCGVFGELYGRSAETRFAHDLPEVVAWIRHKGPEPQTIVDAQLNPERLLEIDTRSSAAYKGIYALLLREGACDWRTGEPSTIQTYFDEKIDIHHVFPRDWCKKQSIDSGMRESIVNKTPLMASTNRSIGALSPSSYLARIEEEGVPSETLNLFLKSHLIDPEHLRSDDFSAYFEARQKALLNAISKAMGKPVTST